MVTLQGNRPAQIRFAGSGRINYSLIGKAYQRWGREEASLSRPGLNLSLCLSKTQAASGKTIVIRLDCTNTLLEPACTSILSVGLAPGMKPSLAYLDELLRSQRIDRYEIADGTVTLYLSTVPGLVKLTFDLPVFGTRPGKYLLPPSILYEYYAPDNLSVSSQETIEILSQGE
jgi:hypothetical protein